MKDLNFDEIRQIVRREVKAQLQDDGLQAEVEKTSQIVQKLKVDNQFLVKRVKKLEQGGKLDGDVVNNLVGEKEEESQSEFTELQKCQTDMKEFIATMNGALHELKSYVDSQLSNLGKTFSENLNILNDSQDVIRKEVIKLISNKPKIEQNSENDHLKTPNRLKERPYQSEVSNQK